MTNADAFVERMVLFFLIQSTVNMASRAKETGIYMDFCSSGALTGGLHWDMVPFLVDV